MGALILAWPSISYGQYLEAYFPRGVPGYGQELGVDVLSRLRPLYEEPGVRAGSFIIRPQLTEAIGYDFNPAGFSSGAGSGVLRTSPSLAVNSDWSRDSLGANLAVDSHRYWDTPRQSYTNWSASIGGGYTIGRSDLTLAYSHLSLHQTAGSIGAVPSDTPVHFQVDDLRAAYTFNLGRLSFTPNVDVRNYYFDNTTILGIPTSQQYRNRAVLSGGVTTRYSLSDLRSLLFVLQGVDFTSHHSPARRAILQF